MRVVKLDKFAKWYKKLDITQKTEIDVRLTRIFVDRYFGQIRKLGKINELKFKSGLRVYFGFDGKDIVLLINGGSKNSKRGQTRDIEIAKQIYQEYLDDK